MISSASPIFVTSDIDRTEAFFQEALAFSTEQRHSDYLIMQNEQFQIHFSKLKKIDKKKNYCACYLVVDNMDTLYQKCEQMGCVHPNGKIAELPWGREFSILDPDWNLIKILEKQEL